MDADVESFLRDKRSLIQIIGRAARNSASKVIFFADKITNSMQAAIDETYRRRAIQIAHNTEHNITPTTVKRDVTKSISSLQSAIAQASKSAGKKPKEHIIIEDVIKRMADLEEQMTVAAEKLDFETAIKLRSEWFELKNYINCCR